MKDSIIISIASIRGTYHFNLTRIFRRNVFISSIVLVIVLVVVVGVVSYIVHSGHKAINEHKSLVRQTQLLKSQINGLENNKELLEQELILKKDEIENFEVRVAGIEQALGLEASNDIDIEARLDTATVNSVTRQSMFQFIPNGSPVKDKYRISSEFGWRTHPILGKQKHHNGMDFAAPSGTKIYAPADGVVEMAKISNQGYGTTLKIRHAFGFSTVYAHLNKINNLSVGDFVHKDQPVAEIGSSGLSTGNHLHYEIHFLGNLLNPAPFTSWDALNFDVIFKERKVKWESLVKMLQNQASKANVQLQLSLHKDVQSMEISN